ncbi:MAG: hypothetical protein HUU20_25070, partial [Pirellulales bacterium]|nr:hypothetical protein [Pirellulales bacterium]
MSQPVHCHPRAFHLFARCLAAVDSNEGLLRAAVAVSLHELDGADPEQVVRRLGELAQRV